MNRNYSHLFEWSPLLILKIRTFSLSNYTSASAIRT